MKKIDAMWRGLATFFLILSVLSEAFAISVPRVQKPLRDDANLLDYSSAATVRKICNDLKSDTSAELVVLIVHSTGGENQHDFALRTFNQWGIGRARVDDGVLIMFAIRDRRVEIIPGDRYQALFTAGASTGLLREHVVPKMKAGNSAAGVIAGVQEVAARVRAYERGLVPAERSIPSKGSLVPTVGGRGGNVSGVSRQPTRPGGVSPARVSGNAPAVPVGAGAGPGATSGFFSAGGASRAGRMMFMALLGAWFLFGGVFFYNAFNSGTFILPKWQAYLIMVAGGVLLAWLGITFLELERSTFDQVGAGSGGVGVLVFFFLGSHFCPRCNRWLTSYSRTINDATYYSSGLGETTEHCDSCFYHHVYTYTISMKQRHHHSSSSSSSSRSSGGRSSGGRSSGGGGGASW